MIPLSLKLLTCTRLTEPSMRPRLAAGLRNMQWVDGDKLPDNLDRNQELIILRILVKLGENV